MRLSLLLCLLAVTAPVQPPGPSAQARDPECYRPLDEFCPPGTCSTYAKHVEKLRGGGHCYGTATIGRCGPFRTTHEGGNGFWSETRYYDKAGNLVAARTDGDVGFDNRTCPTWKHYGAVVTCKVTRITQLCKP
jgi:hypothetical protein